MSFTVHNPASEPTTNWCYQEDSEEVASSSECSYQTFSTNTYNTVGDDNWAYSYPLSNMHDSDWGTYADATQYNGDVCVDVLYKVPRTDTQSVIDASWKVKLGTSGSIINITKMLEYCYNTDFMYLRLCTKDGLFEEYTLSGCTPLDAGTIISLPGGMSGSGGSGIFDEGMYWNIVPITTTSTTTTTTTTSTTTTTIPCACTASDIRYCEQTHYGTAWCSTLSDDYQMNPCRLDLDGDGEGEGAATEYDCYCTNDPTDEFLERCGQSDIDACDAVGGRHLCTIRNYVEEYDWFLSNNNGSCRFDEDEDGVGDGAYRPSSCYCSLDYSATTTTSTTTTTTTSTTVLMPGGFRDCTMRDVWFL
jgi:hypothetical protein